MEKKLRCIVIVEAFSCLAVSLLLYFVAGITNATYVFQFPFEVVGKGLRMLSLSSATGNIVAVILYSVLCLLPMMYYIKDKKKTPMPIFLSAYTFFMMYYFINPARMQTLFRPELSGEEALQVEKAILALIFYTLLIGYYLMRSMRKMKKEEAANSMLYIHLIRVCRVFAIICTALGVFMFMYEGIDKIKTVVSQEFSAMDVWVVMLEVSVSYLPVIFVVLILIGLSELLERLRESPYSEQVIEKAKELSLISRVTVYSCIIGCIGVNLLQLVLASILLNVSVTLYLPILPLVMSYGSMILATYFRDSRQLYEENQMII